MISQAMLDNLKKMAEMLRPPTDDDLIKTLSGMPDWEVEGLYRWGSPKGKKLAKIECLRRGIIKEPFLKRLFSKLK